MHTSQRDAHAVRPPHAESHACATDTGCACMAAMSNTHMEGRRRGRDEKKRRKMRESKGGGLPRLPGRGRLARRKNHEGGWGGGRGGYVTMERMNSLGSICLTERADRRAGGRVRG